MVAAEVVAWDDGGRGGDGGLGVAAEADGICRGRGAVGGLGRTRAERAEMVVAPLRGRRRRHMATVAAVGTIARLERREDAGGDAFCGSRAVLGKAKGSAASLEVSGTGNSGGRGNEREGAS